MAENKGTEVGGGYVRIGVDMDPLKAGLAESRRASEKAFSDISRMGGDFARSLGSALGFAVPTATAAGAAATIAGVFSKSLDSSSALGRLMSIVGQKGGDIDKIDFLAKELRRTAKDSVGMDDADARAIMARGMEAGYIGANGSKANNWFDLITKMSLIGGVTPQQAAEDAAQSYMGGANLGRYGVHTPGGGAGMIGRIQFDQLENRMRDMSSVAKDISSLPGNRIDRMKKNASNFAVQSMEHIGTGMGVAAAMLGNAWDSMMTSPNDETSLDIKVGLMKPMAPQTGANFGGPTQYNRDTQELIGLLRQLIQQQKPGTQGLQ